MFLSKSVSRDALQGMAQRFTFNVKGTRTLLFVSLLMPFKALKVTCYFTLAYLFLIVNCYFNIMLSC